MKMAEFDAGIVVDVEPSSFGDFFENPVEQCAFVSAALFIRDATKRDWAIPPKLVHLLYYQCHMFSLIGTQGIDQKVDRLQLLGICAATSLFYPMLTADSSRLPLVWMVIAEAIGANLNCSVAAVEALVHQQVFVDTRKEWRTISSDLIGMGLARKKCWVFVSKSHL